MTSYFSWLDYSEHERRKMLDVIDLFREKDTRDELGIGSVRDAFADLFFPGTSTIQTRARYFFFVPWLYLELERKRIPSDKIARRIKDSETALIYGLTHSGEKEGVIGQRVKEHLQRLPSSIYWQGLGTLGFRRFPGSQDQYHRSLDNYYLSTNLRGRDTEADSELFISRRIPNWHTGLPSAPKDFPNTVTLALTQTEAKYLQERILTQASSSLFAFWADRRKPPLSHFPWEIPDIGYSLPLQEQLRHAQNFSEAIHGAALLYNLMLAEHVEDNSLIEAYREQLSQWSESMEAHHADLAKWNLSRFWEISLMANPRVPRTTRFFIDNWLALALTPKQAVADDEQARQLVHDREHSLKRGLARLENRRALDLWHQAGGAAGIGRLDYRWNIAQRHLSDIHSGLNLKER